MRASLSASVFASLLLLSAPHVMAQEGPGKACAADRDKFCAGLKPGDGKFGACMKEHEAEFSDACKSARADMQEARKNVRMNCKADVEKFCADAEKGRGETIKCLRSHAGEVGTSCADALQAMPGAKKS
jgi:hypothetical protein